METRETGGGTLVLHPAGCRTNAHPRHDSFVKYSNKRIQIKNIRILFDKTLKSIFTFLLTEIKI